MNAITPALLAALLCLSWTGKARAAAPAPDSVESLEERFTEAQEAKDIDALMNLVYWKDVPDSIRGMSRRMFNGITENPLSDITFVSGSMDEKLEYTRDNIRYKPNLKTVGELKVQVEGAPKPIGLPVGELNGRYYIASAAPEAAVTPEPAPKPAPPAAATASTAAVAAAAPAPKPVPTVVLPAPKSTPPAAAPKIIPAAPHQSGVKGGGISDTDLTMKFRSAHEAKNVEALLQLFDGDGLSAEDRVRFAKILKDSFNDEIMAVEVHPAASGRGSIGIRTIKGMHHLYESLSKEGRRFLKVNLPPPSQTPPENKQSSVSPLIQQNTSGETDGDVHIAGFVNNFKGTLTLNGNKSCLFSGEQSNFGCPSFFDQIRYGRNSIEVQYEPLGASGKSPPQLEVQVFKFHREKGGRIELYAWKVPAPKTGKDTFAFSVER